MDELNSPSTIIKNIVLEGSGEDCIFKHSVNVAALSLLWGKWIGYDKTKLNRPGAFCPRPIFPSINLLDG